MVILNILLQSNHYNSYKNFLKWILSNDLVTYLKLVLIFALVNYRIIVFYPRLTSQFESSFLKLDWEKRMTNLSYILKIL